jgi:hypothetical protein
MVSSAQTAIKKHSTPEDPANGLLAPTPAAPEAATLLSPNNNATLAPPSAQSTRNHHRHHSNSHPPLFTIGEIVQSFDEYHAGRDGQEKERERQREKEVEETKGKNRVLGVLMSRLGNSKTFGENVIFMLNRCRQYRTNLQIIHWS